MSIFPSLQRKYGGEGKSYAFYRDLIESLRSVPGRASRIDLLMAVRHR